MALPSCSAFTSRTNFEDYIGVLRNVTHGDFSLVRECRSEICSALWGSGNPDISGIGMAIGYILESFIALLLVIASLWNIRSRGGERTGWLADLLLSNAATTFYDNAIYFTLAIQVASVITLARANFGISADGMGAITMKIAWLVSTLTLMPLMTMVLRPQMFSERRDDGEDDGERHDNTYAEEAEKAEGDETKCRCEKQSTAISEARQRQRFLLFVLCWAMSFYPFFSRMAGTFGKLSSLVFRGHY